MIKLFQRRIKGKYFQKSSKPPELLIELFKRNILLELKNSIKGIYIIGSYGLNDFNPNLSDIDFIVTLDQELSNDQMQQLERIHLDIEKDIVQPNLNGLYILEKQVGYKSHQLERLSYFHQGEFKTDFNKTNYYEITPITWAELQSNAVTIFGKKREQLEINLDWKEVDQYLYENINSYWKRWLEESKNPFHNYYYATLFNTDDNIWCVAGVSRQLYSLIEERITSKRGACEYLLSKVPEKHLAILRDAIQHRKGMPTRKAWQQKQETLAFMKYVIGSFNEVYEEKYSS